MSATPRVARVVPDVTGLDKEFDYLVPAGWQPSLVVPGAMVRMRLQNRRVAGWVVEVGPADGSVSPERLIELSKWSGLGPSPEIIDLARWASIRWAAGRLRPFLVAASPPVMVHGLPPRRRAKGGHVSSSLPRLVQQPPTGDPVPLILEASANGPMLIIHPSLEEGRRLASVLRGHGLTTARYPHEWAHAAAGVDVVIGGRSAVWATCDELRAIMVLDEHDEGLQEERAPTWHARDVAIERATRIGAACVLVSPCPSATGLHWAGDDVRRPSLGDERDGWPILEIVDRTKDEPWKRSLLTSPLIQHLRNHERRVVCVLNTKGRARLLACRTCRALQRCEHCQAAVVQDTSGSLVCHRCGTTRPVVCQNCGSGALAVIRPGVARLREEIEAAAGRSVGEVTGQSEYVPDADVLVGTEAVLHRVQSADVVAFLDLDAELLAPRYRAAEQAMALLVRAARLVGPRGRGGRLLVQTFLPRHEVLQSVLYADPSRAAKAELQRRQLLSLPPFSALAAVSGPGASEFAAASGLEASPTDGTVLLRATSWDDLGAALAATPRPRGSRLRVEVDPAR